MDICDSRHSRKWKIMRKPPNEQVYPRMYNVVNVPLRKIRVSTLPADSIPTEHKGENGKGGGRAPVDNRISEEIVLDDVIIPGAHPDTDMEDGPLPPFRSQVVLLIGFRHKGVVGRHHGNVKVDEVPQKGGSEGLFVGLGKYRINVRFNVPMSESVARLVLISTSNLNLMEPPLWEIDISSAEIAPKNLVSQSEGGRKGAQF